MRNNKILSRIFIYNNTIKYARKTDVDLYIPAINIIADAMKIGSPYFVDITNQVTTGTGMAYKVYELQKIPDELTKLIEFNQLWITIVNPNKDKDSRYLTKAAEINPNDEMIIFPNLSEFKKIKQDPNGALHAIMHKEKFESKIIHELAHQLNKIRSNNVIYRSTGGKSQFDPQKQEYFDSTEEVQARLIPIINNIYYAAKNPSLKMGEVINECIKNNNFTAFKEYIFGIYFTDLHIEDVGEQTKKRYIKRLYEIFSNLRNDL